MAETITGDNDLSFYRSGPDLIEFFNEFGFNDTYENFPTRWVYADSKIKEVARNHQLIEFINYALSEESYVDINTKEYEVQDNIIQYWNKYLKFDGYEILRDDGRFLLKDLKSAQVVIKEKQFTILSTDFMMQQINKCENKLMQGDFDGAITNARSLVEEVLLEVEERIKGERCKNTGDISTLYNRVKKLINFDPGQEGLNDSLKQILQGLNSIVLGIGKIRSKASDSHSQQYKPLDHHARLAVNSAQTFTSFIIDSFHYQQNK